MARRKQPKKLITELFGALKKKSGAFSTDTRNYAAAKSTDLTSKWGTTPVTPDQAIKESLQSLRARSRNESRNNDYARKFINMVKTNVIGTDGVRVISEAIDLSGNPDKAVRDAIEKHWQTWTKKKNCDFKGRLGFVTMQKLIMGSVAIDGESFIRIHNTGPMGYQLELIDPELVDIHYNDELRNGSYIQFGIEYSNRGQVEAYHVKDLSKVNHQSQYAATSTKYDDHIRIPADEMIHLFLPEYVSQSRGMPWMSSALLRMRHLNLGEEAALIAFRVGASKMGFFKSTGEGAQYAGDYQEDGDMYMEAEPGVFSTLPAGTEFQSFDPSYPSGDYGPFISTCLQGIAAGLGVSASGLSGDMSKANYSSMRVGALEEREVWKSLHKWLCEDFMEVIFEQWLEVQYNLKAIKIQAKGGRGPIALKRRLSLYQPVRFVPRAFGWIDPLKDIQATEKEIALGIKSISSVIREQGRDVEQTFSEIAAERERLSALGISLEVFNAAVTAQEKGKSNE